MNQEQQGKVAIVTGGASGVGAASARWLAARGYHVLVNYERSADMARAVVSDCAALGVQAMAVQGNVALDIDCISVVQQAVSRWGRLDVLVNSAGAPRPPVAAAEPALHHGAIRRATACLHIGLPAHRRQTFSPLSKWNRNGLSIQ